MKIKAFLQRLKSDEVQTLGHLNFYLDGLFLLFNCVVLELPDNDNKFQISRILSGKYRVVKRHSPKYGWHWHVLDVEGRTLILIHFGNYHKDTKGCILVGADYVDINNDGKLDVTSSKKTMRSINALVDANEFELVIYDEVA